MSDAVAIMTGAMKPPEVDGRRLTSTAVAVDIKTAA